MRARLRTPRDWLADRDGSVLVEFAVLSIVLLMFSAAGVDLANIAGYHREIERSTTQIAAAITSCPPSSTPGYVSCTTDTIKDYTARKANTLIRFPTMELSIMQINKVSGAIRVCAGTGTYLDADIKTRALAVLDDKDVAIVVVMSMNYLAFLPVLTKLYVGSGSKTLRGFTIAVQASNAQVC
ncbi:hypothetical protein ASG52_17960 [Methylobacterium sp. Leaf456]|uniref:TadE/TadG family type IV pilus assembly protein n=1 Tax=Methylobacterium sp. Leaf456 TaxID=1736382 RepID=UPI0006F5386D|nr:hypothetical protein [Methylobacterium sp. Leaf456]KQT61114.1 hypothetical protein ASG52_17960 [Methylobacterium sp. Leaf456]